MMSTSSRITCKRCNTQLASRDPDGLSICRGGLEATITGAFTVSIRCYRCSAVNVLSAPAVPEQHPVRRPGAARA